MRHIETIEDIMSNGVHFFLQVDMAMLHSHLYEHSLQGVAATISLANLLIATLRYNERLTGKTSVSLI